MSINRRRTIMTRDPDTGRFSNRPAQRSERTQRTWSAPQSQKGTRADQGCEWGGGGVGTALSVVGGAALGATLMFLLDPEAGERRRRAAREAAAHAIDATG